MEPVQWEKLLQVRAEDGFLVANLDDVTRYPLLEAAHEARGLRALLDAHTVEQLCQFTKNWGFLYPRLDGGRRDRFPLDLLELHRRELLALAKLCEVLRLNVSSETIETTQTLKQLREIRRALSRWRFGDGPIAPPQGLTPEEREYFNAGVPADQLLLSRHRTAGKTLQQHAADILATSLDTPQRLRAARHRHEWRLEYVPSAYTLEQVLKLSLQTRFRIVHRFLCESCGREAAAFRSNARFCSDECSGRQRVQRHRQKRV
jgi:hypothetical protein